MTTELLESLEVFGYCGKRTIIRSDFERATKPIMREAKVEIERLTAALHAAKAHPDYAYFTTPRHGTSYAKDIDMTGAGWELNTEANPQGCIDLSWRRRKETLS